MTGILIGALVTFVCTSVLGFGAAMYQRRVTARQGHASPGLGATTFSGGVKGIRAAGGAVVASAPAAQVLAQPTPGESKSVAAAGAQLSATIDQTNFINTPITQQVSTFLFGDDLYDESYGLDVPGGMPLGEMGVSISEAVTWDGIKHVIAFEVWLFDMTTAATVSKIIVTPTAGQSAAVKQKFAAKGEVVSATPGAWTALKTDGVSMYVRVVDSAEKAGTRIPGVIFERLALEIAAWKAGQEPALPSAKPAAPPEPTPAEAAASAEAAQKAEDEGPQLLAQDVKSSYLIEYASRVYFKQPFTVHVSLPGGLPETESSKSKAKPAAAKPAAGVKPEGAINFIHRSFGAASASPELPRIGVWLSGDEKDFHIPVATATGTLTPSGHVEFDFPVRPLKAETLLLTVKMYYMGNRHVDEKMLEVEERRDPVTGAVSQVTKKQPERITEELILLAQEVLPVESRSFFGLNAETLNLGAVVLGLVIIAGFVFAMLRPGADMLTLVAIGGGAVIALLPLLLGRMVAGGDSDTTPRRVS